MHTEHIVAVPKEDGRRNAARPRETAAERSGPRVRVTFYLAETLLDELRDVTVALSGPPNRLTLSRLAESALQREVRRLKRLHQGGRDFDKRRHQLRPGRPIE
jgi:hypothetical protein